MEPETQQDNRTLRILTSIFIGLLASAASIAFFLFVAWAIFVYFASTISFESGGSIALGIDIRTYAVYLPGSYLKPDCSNYEAILG